MPIVRNSVFEVFQGIETQQNYKTIWDHFQNTAIKRIVNIIKKEFPGANVLVARAKSTFPDVKIEYGSQAYAIDVKSSESRKDPWYDIARLDTIVEKRLETYTEEYDIIIKYDKDTGKVENVFFEPMYKTVGKDLNSGGVKFRPYDGKLRPKPWEMFEAGKAYWNSKEEFLRAVIRSMNYRRCKYIEQWWRELPSEDKEKLRKQICRTTLEKLQKK